MTRKFLILFATAALSAFGQSKVDLRTQAKSVDFSGASATKPAQMGTTLPATCGQGEFFFLSTAPAGQNVYGCSIANTWSLEGASVPPVSLLPAQGNSAGQLLTTNGATPAWQPLGGDISGPLSSLTVTALRGRALAVTTPTDGQLLEYSAASNNWTPLSLSGDVHGNPATLTVAALQGRGVSNATPATGQLLGWSSANGSWTPTTLQIPPNYGFAFTSATTFTIPGTLHNLNTANLIVSCYDTAAPANVIEPGQVTVDPITFNVTVSFATPQSGHCSVNGSGGVGMGAVSLTGSAVLTFPAISNATCSADLAITVPGALTTDGIAAGWPALPAGFIGMVRVSANNTIAFRLCNFSGVNSAPPPLTYIATIVRPF